ncbi:DUF2254 domain-containing protein [Pseudazoarcus pumilus]|uniref:DUF2254 domain-containing protein n=1 Tax=Pseudazoarcus pumilus TaxID=2067960 RepID=A0A2I6S9V5_9RHOO|nr:DUF2254 domain-containing protein [Pseudazoarcus pumilus]AUN96043.1 DUF2254 domain-containing protein [Pseudazoarcus pumilus]
MTSRWEWVWMQFTRRLWVRAALISLLAVVAVGLAGLFRERIPDDFAAMIGAGSVDDILSILASSMLAVTTFSLTTMVSAYGAATSQVTPRATRLLREDTTTQNVLATFIGSFLFALLGIVALATELYGEQGRVTLFVFTIGVIVLIVVTLLRWIQHLSAFGRVDDTTRRVEEAASEALANWVEAPCLGARLLADPDDIPENATALFDARIGYVQHIDVGVLQDWAEAHSGEIYVVAVPGSYVEPSRPVAWITGDDTDDGAGLLLDAFVVDNGRSFYQDPRFGLSVLAEIASRALSPAVNDPATAIDVIGRAVRALAACADFDGRPGDEVPCPRVHVPTLDVGDFFNDVFAPIARDGASLVEVHMRLLKALAMLARMGANFREPAMRLARLSRAHAEAALALDEDKTLLRRLAAEVGEEGVERGMRGSERG